MSPALPRRLFAEALGSALLTGVVIGSGILAVQLSAGNDAVALIGNTAATAAILVVLITGLGPVSGAHFNPAVSLVMALRGALKPGEAAAYGLVQVLGCCAGAVLAHAMFELPLLQAGSADRSGVGKLLAEAVASFALVFAILSSTRHRPDWTPAIVALVITAGYWWTSSTSFANPAITVARSLTDTFAGIRWIDAPGFILAQLVGAVAGSLACDALFGRDRGDAAT